MHTYGAVMILSDSFQQRTDFDSAQNINVGNKFVPIYMNTVGKFSTIIFFKKQTNILIVCTLSDN